MADTEQCWFSNILSYFPVLENQHCSVESWFCVMAPQQSDPSCFPAGARRSIYANDKVYLGVRVRMPVKDLLRNIRLTQGCGQDLKVGLRFKTHAYNKSVTKIQPHRNTFHCLEKEILCFLKS